MSDEQHGDQIKRDIERLLRAMKEEGVAGGMVGPNGLTLGVPNWAERTKDLRFSQKVKTHGYPLGLAKSTHWNRDRLLVAHRDRVESMSVAERSVHEAVHEVVAWALDAERFLGSFNCVGEDHFPVSTVDAVADHLLIWLEVRGCRVVPTHLVPRFDPPPAPLADHVLYIDFFSGMVLDELTCDLYQRILEEELPFEDADEREELNAIAAGWCQSLRLSELLPGENLPPTGHVGQYGRYGCVLLESASNQETVLHDVCLFVYDAARMGDFLQELTTNGDVAFVASSVTDVDVVEHISGLHSVSRWHLGPSQEGDLAQVDRQTDVEGALTWGRHHAQQLAKYR